MAAKQVGRIVYSTEQGKMCPECGQAISSCVCHRKKTIPVSEGIVRVSK